MLHGYLVLTVAICLSKQGTRPIIAADDPSVAVCVADSRVVVYDTVEETHKLWIKVCSIPMLSVTAMPNLTCIG
jgi:hypothetical protein